MNITLKSKLAVSFGVVLVIFAAAGIFSSITLREQREIIEEITGSDQPMLNTLQDVLHQLKDYRKDEKDVLLNIGVPAKQRGYFDQLQKRSTQILAQLDELEKRTAGDDELSLEVRKFPATAREGFTAYDKAVRELCAKLLEEGGGGVTAQDANAQLTKHKDGIHLAEVSLRELNKQAQEMILTNQTELAVMAERTANILLGSLGLGILAGIVLGVGTLLSITRPLARVMAFAGSVAKGDLNAQAEGTFTAEMAELKLSIESMVTTLRNKIEESDHKSAEAAEQARLAQVATAEANEAKALAERAKAEGMMQAAGQLERVVEVVSSASEQLSAQIEQSSRGTEVQSARVAETATAMEEMNSTVLEVARNASQAAESTDNARKKAAEGSQVVSQVVAGIDDMQRVSLALKEDMEVLGKQAEGIGQVMNVISDIADQTNLLALNAAIEAARAGDAGRGFAVVADEVRKLAEKTMTATKEVGEAISGIQQGTRKNLENVERSARTVQQATELANKSGEALVEIVHMVETATDQVRSIATASEEQSATSEEIQPQHRRHQPHLQRNQRRHAPVLTGRGRARQPNPEPPRAHREDEGGGLEPEVETQVLFNDLEFLALPDGLHQGAIPGLPAGEPAQIVQIGPEGAGPPHALRQQAAFHAQLAQAGLVQRVVETEGPLHVALALGVLPLAEGGGVGVLVVHVGGVRRGPVPQAQVGIPGQARAQAVVAVLLAIQAVVLAKISQALEHIPADERQTAHMAFVIQRAARFRVLPRHVRNGLPEAQHGRIGVDTGQPHQLVQPVRALEHHIIVDLDVMLRRELAPAQVIPTGDA